MNLTAKEKEELLTVLKKRFHENKHRHEELDWATIEEQLLASPTKLKAVFEIEKTGLRSRKPERHHRYDTVFTYHNGASSYYAARGFRGCIEFD